jgi:hypothetical protein
MSKRVPQLRKKSPEERDHDLDSLAVALNWDELADPGDADYLKAWLAAEAEDGDGEIVIDTPLGMTEDGEA